MAVAPEPANAAAQSGIRSDHGPIMEWPKSVAMRMQEPGAGASTAEHHELYRRLFAGKDEAETGAGCCAAERRHNVCEVMWTDAVQVAAVDIAIARLRG